MRNISKSLLAPEDFRLFVLENPEAKWSYLSSNRDLQDIKENLKRALYDDQLGLCAYCESKLHLAGGVAVDDFRVEHFHPKSDETGSVNWNLLWENLLAVCTGGNQNSLADKSKFTKPDYSCDVPKDHKILDDVIINPSTDLSEGDKIFYFRSDGKMVVHENCPDALRLKASACIRELRLSEIEGVSPPAKRLDTLREGVISKVVETIGDEVRGLIALDPALDEETLFTSALFNVAERIIPDPSDPPSFLSAVQQFLGK